MLWVWQMRRAAMYQSLELIARINRSKRNEDEGAACRRLQAFLGWARSIAGKQAYSPLRRVRFCAERLPSEAIILLPDELGQFYFQPLKRCALCLKQGMQACLGRAYGRRFQEVRQAESGSRL